MHAVLATLSTLPTLQVVQVEAVSYDKQLTMALDTRVHTPLVLGKYPVAQIKQVNGATEVALMQLESTLDTQEVMPLVVWSPKPGAV